MHSPNAGGLVGARTNLVGAPQKWYVAILLVEAIQMVYNLWCSATFYECYALHKFNSSASVTVAIKPRDANFSATRNNRILVALHRIQGRG